MLSKQQLKNLINSDSVYLQYTEENSCPICKLKISPLYLFSSLNTEDTASVFNFCKGCESTFVTTYSLKKSSDFQRTNVFLVNDVLSSEPNRFKRQEFDDFVTEISPSFVEIYNQALASESYNLNEIAGLGYRKSLEFLIKDFAIHLYPEKAEEIKQKLLSPCIKDYITDPSIKMLATKSAWIGNDEAHYTRKQENRDINDMKRFISAIVHFISIILITEDAATIEPK